MIKKAFYILLVALMALPVSCSKDHKSSKATPGIKASNLEGTWIATQYINGDMEDVSNICLLIKSSNPGFTYTLFNEGGGTIAKEPARWMEIFFVFTEDTRMMILSKSLTAGI